VKKNIIFGYYLKKINIMNKITIKNYYLFLIALFFLAINTISAQGCIVYDDLTLTEQQTLGINEQEFQANDINSLGLYFSTPPNYQITPKKMRINFWAIMNDEGTAGVYLHYEMAVKYVNRLNKLYEPYQICFVLNGNGVLKHTGLLHNLTPLIAKGTAQTKNAYVDDAINVYVAKTLGDGAFGIASFLNNTIVVKEDVMWWSEDLLAHEVAHALGIMHTIGNRNLVPNSPNGMGDINNCEHVTRDPNDPNYNADSAGDWVRDTAADPGFVTDATKVNYNMDANCNYIGNQVNCDGTNYQVDNALISNLMSYGGQGCKTGFSLGQAERMHYALDNLNPASKPIVRALIPNPDFDFDFVIRNSDLDYGVEPDTVSPIFWDSPDVWIRKVDDNVQWHENPVYGIGNNYAKVRVVNRGCATSDGEGKIKLYWTKAGTSLPMQAWDGGISINGVPMGGLIGEADLPAMESFEEIVFTFPWPVPNPADYSTINEPWHFCLLAKIESPTDISTLPQDNGVYYNFLNSNNIALRNVSVINNTSSNSGKIHIGNFTGTVKKFKLKLSNYISYNSNTNIFNEAEVKFTFDNKLWKIWQNSGFQGTNFKEFGDKTIIVNEDTEIFLSNFPANDFGVLNVKVNFLTDAYTSNDQFGFNVEHWDNDTNELMGGELYLVNKNQRDLFEADAFVTNNTLQAVSINESAVYNWYDANGTLLHTGQNYTVSNTNGTYLLEVVADYDGYKDMKEVAIAPNNAVLLHNIYPNPATSNVTVQYNQLNCNNAYLMLVNVNNNASSNYIINLNSNYININTSQFTSGLYRVVLVCDNNVIESHNLIIQ